MKIFVFILIFLGLLFGNSATVQKENSLFVPGKIMNDTDGNIINAHGGGMLYYNNKYYWYGEIKKGPTRRVEYINSWECYRTDAGGVSCYSSADLMKWEFEGVALAPDKVDPAQDLNISKVIERPKVIYNEKTKKFVMWMHIDSEDYSFARAGVAVSSSPAGPFQYIGSLRPNGEMSRDMTLFKDDDGKAYHIFSSENNATMHISLLTDDYLQPSGKVNRIFIDKSREAPALFKHNGKYYLITSGCTGWSPNKAMLAVSDSIMGTWEELYNPCFGPESETTFDSQSTFVLPLNAEQGKYLFMADKWNKTDLKDSRYVWLPLVFRNDSAIIEWESSWKISDAF